MSTYHRPVMLTETLEWLSLAPGRIVVDGTLGGGGHSKAIAERVGPDGFVLGLDQDSDAIAEATAACAGLPLRTWQGNFAEIATALAENQLSGVDGVLLDLGVSSHQLDTPARGFAIKSIGPLDMRMAANSDRETAAELLNRLPEAEIARILFEYGEEQRSRRIAAEIVRARPLKTTEDLVDCVRRAMPFRTRPGEIHPATKVFQGVRIAVNDELGVLERGLRAAVAALNPGGRIAVIAYHSLEDRIVKMIFNELSGKREGSDLPDLAPPPVAVLEILTKKPLAPTEQEVRENPRARSARFRVAQKR